MTASPFYTVVCNLLAILLLSVIASGRSLAQDGTSFAVIQPEASDLQQPENDIPANRVLPVDAEHKSKITFPQQSLDPICVQTLRENLVKFLKRVKRNGLRQARQDDGDDGDDGEEGGGGLLAGIGEGNGALGAFAQLPSLLPQFVTTLTQISGAVNQGLNGTDTPNLSSFLVKQGQQLIQALTASQANRGPPPRPSPVHVDRVPGSGGSGGIPPRKPRPPSYEIPPGADPEDYIDEDVKQPLQPTVRPLRPDIEFGRPAGYDPYPGNPFLENADIRRPISSTQDTNVETINGLPPKTSLWQIYKTFRNKPPGNGSLTEFQLAHPEAFSNELLQSISASISNVRGQSPSLSLAVPTDKPSSEIFKQFYPSLQKQPSIFGNQDRPTLSVYKPASTISGVGVGLSNLALNASKNTIETQSPPDHSSEHLEEANVAQSIQQELESVSSLMLSKPGGSGGFTGEYGKPAKPAYNIKNSVASTGSLSQLQAQQTQGANYNPTKFVKPPPSSHFTAPTVQYVPAVSSLHQVDEDLQQVGPQTNDEDTYNGFINKTPYRPVNGVLLQAPKLTPAPLFSIKPPSNLQINEQTQEQSTSFPEFSYQNTNAQPGSVSSSLYPAQSLRPKDPNAPRAPTVSAAIASNFPQFSQKPNSFQNLPPSLVPQKNNQVPESEAIRSTVASTDTGSQEETTPNQPEEDIAAPISHKNNYFASSLTNLAHESISQHMENSNFALPEESQNAPGSSNGEQNSASSPFNSLTQNENSKLLLYLLTNFPHLLGINANPDQSESDPQTPNESTSPLSSTSDTSTVIPTVAPQVQEEVATSSSADQFPVVQVFVPGSGIAEGEIQETTSVPHKGQLGAINSNILSSNWNIDSAQLSGIPPIVNNVNNQQQNYVQNSDQIGGLIQGPFTNDSDTSTSKVEPEVYEESTTATPTHSFHDVLTNANFASSVQFPSALLPPKPVVVESTYESTAKPIPDSTPAPSFSAEFEFPDLSQLYGNPAPKPSTQSQLQEQTSAAPIVTSTSAPSAVPQQESIPSLNYQHLNGFPSGAELPASSPYVPQIPPLPPPLSQTKPMIVEGTFFQGPSQIGGYPAEIPGTPQLGGPTKLQTPFDEPTTSAPEVSSSAPSNENNENVENNEINGTPLFGVPTKLQSPSFGPSDSAPEDSSLSSNNENVEISAEPFDNVPTKTETPSFEQPDPIPEVSSPASNNEYHEIPGTPFFGVPTKLQSPSFGSSDNTAVVSPSVSSIENNETADTPQEQSTQFPKYSYQNVNPISISSSLILNKLQAPSFRPTDYDTEVSSSVSNSENNEIPGTTMLNGSTNLQTPSFGPSDSVPEVASSTSDNENTETNQPTSPPDNFSQNFSSIGSSAIVEMSKLPYFQLDSFRPSVLPPYLIGNQDSYEQVDSESEKPISELFSSVLAKNVSIANNEIVASTEKVESALTSEEDSIEQQIPNFPPGKPVYWMNMYYPNGIPVLTKVRTTAGSTTVRPKRRRRSTTIGPSTTTTTTPVPDSEYYEDEDPTKPKRKKLTKGDRQKINEEDLKTVNEEEKIVNEEDADFITFTTS